MTKVSDHKHFDGKDAYEHLKDARKKGQHATSETHGAEPSGSMIAACDSARETCLYITLIYVVLLPLKLPIKQLIIILGLFSVGVLFWKICRAGFFGWSRLERLHRLIEEERWEIEHHRSQEKEELLELYKAKGFKDKMLEDVVEVLMADDNRLLQVMLEEELGISLKSFEHPLKLSIGALIGTLCSLVIVLISIWLSGFMGCLIALFCITIAASILFSKTLGNTLIKGCVWNLAMSFLATGVSYFLSEWIYKLVL